VKEYKERAMKDQTKLIENMFELSQTNCYKDINSLIEDAEKVDNEYFYLDHYAKSNWKHVAKIADQSRINIDAQKLLAISMMTSELKSKFNHINEKKTSELVIDLIKDQSYEFNKNFYQTLSKIKAKLSNLFKGYLNYAH